MQKHLVDPVPPPHLPLQPRHTPRDIGAHARRPTNKNTGPAPKAPTHALEHVRNIRAPVLGAPSVLLDGADAGQEGEAHEIFLEHGGGGGEAEVEPAPVAVVAETRVVRGGDVEFEAGFALAGARVRFGRGRKIREGEAGDGVFVLAAQFAFFFRVAACFVADEGAGSLAGDALEGVVDFAVQQVADGAGGGVGLRGGAAAGRVALGGRDEELALHCIWGRVVAADFQFFFEPFECFGAFEGPDDVHGFGHGFPVAHFLDQVEQLADDGGDAAAAGEENDGVEGSQVALHAAVGAVDEGAVRFVRAVFRSGVEDFAGEASEGAED